MWTDSMNEMNLNWKIASHLALCACGTVPVLSEATTMLSGLCGHVAADHELAMNCTTLGLVIDNYYYNL